MASRILFLTCHLPAPPYSGGRRREFELTTRLARDFDVHVWTVTKTLDEDREHAPAFARRCAGVRLFAATAQPCAPDVPPQVARHACPGITRPLSRALDRGDFDLVHVESFYLAQHLPPRLRVPLVLGEQNVESSLWAQRAARAQTPAVSSAARAAHRATRAAELAAWRRADACVAVTAGDRDAMTAAVPGLPVRLVPDGCDHRSGNGAADLLPAHEAGPLLVQVGNFSYEPNVDAALHLCREVLPRVASRHPDVRVAIVGNAPPPEVGALAADPRVAVTGRVPAVEPYLDAATVVVCPLRIGGGIKVKVLEALNRGAAIVTTSVGAQGIDDPRSAMRVEDGAEPFADAVAAVLANPAERERLRASARATAARLPTWDDAAAALAGCYDEVSASAARAA